MSIISRLFPQFNRAVTTSPADSAPASVASAVTLARLTAAFDAGKQVAMSDEGDAQIPGTILPTEGERLAWLAGFKEGCLVLLARGQDNMRDIAERARADEWDRRTNWGCN